MIAIAQLIESEIEIPQNWIEDLQPKLIRFALLRTRDVHLAEDAVQETLFTAARSVDQFRGEGCFEGWVFAILRRKIVDLRRKNARDKRLLMDYYEKILVRDVVACSVSQGLQFEETRSILLDGIEGLPQNQAKVVKLFWLEGLSCGAIAKREGISQGNVWTRIHRARKHLKSYLSTRYSSSIDFCSQARA